MVEYSRSHIKRINSSFAIESFQRKKRETAKETFRLIDVMDLGVYFVVPLLVGLGIGIFADTQLGTKPVGILIGLVFGAVGFFFNLLKIVRQFSKHA